MVSAATGTASACARERWSRTEVRVIQVDRTEPRDVQQSSRPCDEVDSGVDEVLGGRRDADEEEVQERADDRNAGQGAEAERVEQVERGVGDGVENVSDDAGEIDRSKVDRQLWWLRTRGRQMSAG